jgi:hypothetical protein
MKRHFWRCSRLPNLLGKRQTGPSHGRDIHRLPYQNIYYAEYFWKSVAVCLKVLEALVKLLRLVDEDVKPAMVFLYGELLKAKKKIKKAFGNVEKN